MIAENTKVQGLQYKIENNFRTIEIRLDTKSLIEKIEIFLRGYKIIYNYDENKNLIQHKEVTGIPKCNEDGIQSLLNWINGTINPQTVQGNFRLDEKTGESPAYNNYIEEYNISLATFIFENLYEWEIKERDINGIIDFIMLLLQPFMSRLIDNKERESYGESLRSIESNNSVQNESRGFLGLGRPQR